MKEKDKMVIFSSLRAGVLNKFLKVDITNRMEKINND